MPPHWLLVLSNAWLILAGSCVLAIAADLLLVRPQAMVVMNVVWPITALYFGPFALAAYVWFGRGPDRRQAGMPDEVPQTWAIPATQGRTVAAHTTRHVGTTIERPSVGRTDHHDAQSKQRMHGPPKRPFLQTVFIAVCHCGGGCTLGDIVGEWTIFWLGATIAGIALWPEFIADFALAYLIGVAFQFFSIAPMRHLPVARGLRAAVKADTLSLLAFEVGLFGWMALMRFIFSSPPLHPDSPVYWFLMQVGMGIGFLTSYPMNWWLVSHGVKERM